MKWRKWRAFFGLIAALPLIVTATTGLLLQLRIKVEWIQPSTFGMTLEDGNPFLRVEEVLAKFPGNEVQVHPQTGEFHLSDT
jgi:hypothetical protein